MDNFSAVADTVSPQLKKSKTIGLKHLSEKNTGCRNSTFGRKKSIDAISEISKAPSNISERKELMNAYKTSIMQIVRKQRHALKEKNMKKEVQKI